MNGCGRGNNGFNEGEAIRFALGHGRNGAALALAGDDDDAALAGLVLGKAAVDPVFLAVGRLDVAAEITAIHFNRAGERCTLDFGGDGLAELVSENEGRLVLAIEIAGKLEHRNTLDRVRKDDDGG